jgi:hypothetical protein
MSVFLSEQELGFCFVGGPDGALSIGDVRVTAESGWMLLSLDDRSRALPPVIPLRLELLRDENGHRFVHVVTPLVQFDLGVARPIVVPALQHEISRRVALGVGARLR